MRGSLDGKGVDGLSYLDMTSLVHEDLNGDGRSDSLYRMHGKLSL